ncbi:MAG: EAL domain-containing protein, partial [Clostridia bacterium]|nr:EAL domain-containing protein [Clostridia bacterium]
MRKKILVVDDQKINRSILSRLLSDSYEVLEAENGKIALEILRQNSEETSAVILDLIMPVLDGYGVLKAMKEEENLSGIPVIVATQADKGEIEEEALKLGARDFITKPYNPGVLRRRLKNLIELYESNICISHIERDSLTGVYTKEAFCRRASRIIMEHKEKEYLIAATNIKHFKLVNDIFGNQEGDKFLKYIAGIVGKGTEERGGICARSSADHFLCLIPWDKDEKMIRELVDRVSERIDEYPLNMKISMMYGIYEVEDREVPVTIMCDRALLAAQSIKGRYDTAYAFYDDAVRQHLLTEQEITNEMNRALEQEQFQVYFQPKYDLVSEAVAGAEALVRWNHPKLGFMNPVDFVPLFEKNGFITALDKYVWEKTCEMIAKWIKEDKKSVPVSVNVSRKDIYDENLPQTLLNIINKYGLKAEHLHLEITETAYTENADQLIRVVGQLKKLGFVIEMDDFGSGYSSLNMLSELPIDILKLDMRFIQRETAKNDSRGILSFIISMAKWMNLDVVAEGVETQTQVTLLRNIDCDYVQGYFYAKPMTKDEFTRLVRKGNLTADTDEIEQEMIKNGITEHERITEKIMLIVDDLSLNRELLAEYFKGIYTIVEADNGLAAYSYIQEHFDRIEIIMLDLIMPRMDGYELLKKLQSNSLYSPIPVIVTSQVGKDGEAQAFELGASDFLSKPYNYQIARHRVRNVTARLEAQTLRREKDMLSKMRRLALEAKLDPFTGVYNRMEMERQIQDYFNKNQDAHAIFIMLDIDNFKTINDNFGHETGDAAIQKVADILLRKFREEDIVCRMGGDEFAVFIKADFADEHLLQRLSSLHTQLQFTIETQEVTCSIGVCVAPQHGKNYQEMYHNADVSLLTAKRLGKNQVKIYGGTSELPDHVLYRN